MNSSYRIRSLTWSMYAPSFLFSLGMGIVIPVLPLYTHSLGAGLALTGLLVAMRRVGNALFDVPAGMLASRIGHQRLVCISVLGAVAVSLGLGFSRSLLVFGCLNFAAGAMESLWMLSRLTYLKGVVPGEKRGRTLSILGGLMRVGRFAGPIAGGLLARQMGLASSFYAQAAVSFLAFGFVVVFLGRRGARTAGTVPRAEHPLRLVWRTVSAHRMSFLTTGTAMVLLGFVREGREILLPLWGSSIGLDVAQIGLVMGLGSGLDMTLFVPAGIVMDRLGRKWAAVPCLLLLSSSLALMPLAGSFSGLLLVSLLAGLGNGLGSGINMTLGSDLAPPGGADAFLGTWWMVSDVGRSSGPMLIGAIAQALALRVAPLVTSVFGIAGMSILVMFGSETRPRGGRGGGGRPGATGRPARSRAQDRRKEKARACPLGGG